MRANSPSRLKPGWSVLIFQFRFRWHFTLWRLEALGVWRPERPWAGWRALLYPDENRYLALAERTADRIGVQYADSRLIRFQEGEDYGQLAEYLYL